MHEVSSAVNANSREKALDQELLPGRDLRVARMEWLRGPATLDGEWVALDRARARQYDPMEGTELMYDLAAVHRPSDVLAFVQRHGLLRHGPGDSDVRERVVDISEAAADLSTALDWWLLIQRATSGDRQDANDAIRRAWKHADKLAENFDEKATTDAQLITQAAQVVTFWVNQGLDLERVRFKVQPTFDSDGLFADFALSAHSTTLLGAAYHQLAQTIARRVPLRACEECGRKFTVTDRRQRFCSPTCGSRARYRRFSARQKENS